MLLAPVQPVAAQPYDNTQPSPQGPHDMHPAQQSSTGTHAKECSGRIGFPALVQKKEAPHAMREKVAKFKQPVPEDVADNICC